MCTLIFIYNGSSLLFCFSCHDFPSHFFYFSHSAAFYLISPALSFMSYHPYSVCAYSILSMLRQRYELHFIITISSMVTVGAMPSLFSFLSLMFHTHHIKSSAQLLCRSYMLHTSVSLLCYLINSGDNVANTSSHGLSRLVLSCLVLSYRYRMQFTTQAMTYSH